MFAEKKGKVDRSIDGAEPEEMWRKVGASGH
jgi:hypothetical protein